jgi:anti-anti-sigma regulatory factor
MLRCKFLPQGEGIEVIGVLDRSTAPQLEKFLSNYNSGSFRVDMAGLTELDLHGLRPILLVYNRLKKAGGSITLVNVPAPIFGFLEKEGLNFVLPIQPASGLPSAENQ